MKITGAILSLFIFSTLHASNLSKAWDKAVKDTSREIEHVKAHNKGTADFVSKQCKEGEKQGKAFLNTMDREYHRQLGARKDPPRRAVVSQWTDQGEDKYEIGRRIFRKYEPLFAKWQIDQNNIPALNDFLDYFENDLANENLEVQDLQFVINENGDTLLQNIVQNAYDLKLLGIGTDVTQNRAYQMDSFLIYYFARNSDVAAIKNRQGVTPVGWLLRQPLTSWSLVSQIVTNDRTGEAAKEYKRAVR